MSLCLYVHVYPFRSISVYVCVSLCLFAQRYEEHELVVPDVQSATLVDLRWGEREVKSGNELTCMR